jgi:hypothetical protein
MWKLEIDLASLDVQEACRSVINENLNAAKVRGVQERVAEAVCVWKLVTLRFPQLSVRPLSAGISRAEILSVDGDKRAGAEWVLPV